MRKKLNPKTSRLSPTEAALFIEGMRDLMTEKDEPTVAISIRIPANLLRVLKSQARLKGSKYQSMIIQILRTELTKT